MPETVRMDSRDAAGVEDVWRQYVPSARLERIDPERFRFQWQASALEGLALVRYALSATVHSTVRPEDQLFVCRVAAPAGWVRSGRDGLDASQPWATDGTEISAHWEGTAEVGALAFDRAAAQRVARRISGDDALALRLKGTAPRSAAAGRQWDLAFRYLMDAVTSTADDPLIEAELLRHALSITLSTFPSTFLDAIEREPVGPATATVRRAVVYMDEHAHEPLTVDDVAEAVHMSTRGLQYAFRRAFGITPIAYLRRVRLDGAHRDLLSAGPGETVGAVARRWGFGNPSRFAAAYRAAYGCAPRDTIARG